MGAERETFKETIKPFIPLALVGGVIGIIAGLAA